MTVSIFDFEKFCKSRKLNQFIFNTSDQPDERVGMGNCNCIMRFVTCHVVLCPDTIVFKSKYKDCNISFSNVESIEFIEGDYGICNVIQISCRDPIVTDRSITYVILADKI